MSTVTDSTVEPAGRISAETMLANVRELCVELRERWQEIDAARRIPADIHEKVKAMGLYRVMLPEQYGGNPLPINDVLTIVEEIGKADAGCSWSMGIGLQSPHVFGLMPRETFEGIYAKHGPDVTIGGAITPVGKAHRVDGGWRVEGGTVWPFSSGIHNWDYTFANCQLFDEKGEPMLQEDGTPQVRVMNFHTEHITVLDTWKTLGLRSSGSNHFQLNEEIFVADEWTCDPMYKAQSNMPGMFRWPIVEFGYHISATFIGLAQGCLDDFTEAVQNRRRVQSAKTIAEQPVAQYRIGRLVEKLKVTRDALHYRAPKLLAGDYGDDMVTLQVRHWAENANTANTVMEIVPEVVRLYGAAVIWDDNRMQRWLRDAYTISSHAAVNDQSITRAGAKFLGQEVGMGYQA